MILIPGKKYTYSFLQETISQHINEENTSFQIRYMVKIIII